MAGAWSHLQIPSERDFESVMALARQNYLLFLNILGPTGSLPFLGDASDLANLTAAYAYNTQMGLEFPTALERANREWEIQMRVNDPGFWQTPMLTKTWYWSFPWEDVPSEEERRRSHDEP
jgi:hypothetical protein